MTTKIAVLGGLVTVLMGSVPVLAQNTGGPYTVCVGDICGGTGHYNNVNAGLDCGFAAARPADTEEQAAKKVCTILNNFANYSWTRQSSTGGGRCGEIIMTLRCRN